MVAVAESRPVMPSNIEWTDETWNPTRGCRRISPGCEHCYAERVAARFCGPGAPYEGLLQLGRARWNGAARFVGDALDLPLHWRQPRKIFVDSMSDLFYEGFTDDQIDRVWAVMILCYWHTYQVLTKRPARAAQWFERPDFYDRILRAADEFRRAHPGLWGPDRRGLDTIGISNPYSHPARNIWLLVSVEDQKRAAERLPALERCRAAVRGVSYEPALELVDFGPWLGWLIQWLIIGGESGGGARVFDMAWGRAALMQAAAYRVPAFFKQAGKKPLEAGRLLRLKASKGNNPAEWPPEFRVQQWPSIRHPCGGGV